MFPVKITARHARITGDIKAYAQSRAEKLHKYLDRITHIEIILDHAAKYFVAEMVVHTVRGRTLVAKTQDQNYAAALDLVTDKMERQLTKFKERLKKPHLHHRGDFYPLVTEQSAFGSGLEQEDWY
ncbi:MAG: ribosome-associated translation inhibitor RaiA [Planctomycetes bacterium]|nr:ribosome-associated translation inhibitor RaiA [Planctomycetota bacterium]